MIIVDVQGKRFGKTPVLGPISFSIENGSTTALIGPSGIGKSTLLRIVAGIDPDFDGTVARPDRCAMVFQEPTLLPWRSVVENLTLLHPGLSADQALSALDRVGLGDKAELFPGQLSLGQQRRLSLARAFATPPEFLIMDEPFASLDVETAQSMLALTQDLISQHNPATLFVTHAHDEARQLANTILVMRSGPSGAVLA